jgi:hypothetical protein
MPQDWYEHLGMWVAALLTIAILSFLYRDNVIYKFAEHVFVGVAAGYGIALSFWEGFVPKLYEPLFAGQLPGPEDGAWLEPQVWRWLLIVPLLLGLTFFGRFGRKTAWLSRWAIAFLVGCYAGVNATGAFQSDLVLQIKGSFYALIPGVYPDTGYPDSGEITTARILLWNLPILLGLFASLTYFFFSKPHRGFIGVTAGLGIYVLMASFGASFGYTVMARVSLFIGRATFLIDDFALYYVKLLF